MCFVSSGSRVSRFVSRVQAIACCGGILRIDKLNPIVLSSVMLYVHEHNFESSDHVTNDTRDHSGQFHAICHHGGRPSQGGKKVDYIFIPGGYFCYFYIDKGR